MSKKKNGPKEQLKIAGTERKDRIVELDELAEEYRSTRDQRMGLQAEESEMQADLEKLMAAHGLERYVYEDAGGDLEEVTVRNAETKVSVRKLKNKKDAAA